MVSDTAYEICLPILQDKDIEDEDKTDKLQELLRKETSLSGAPLEDAVLDILWRYRDSSRPSATSPAVRHTVIRRSSPAPWQIPRASTPLSSPPAASASPAVPPGFGVVPPAFKPSFTRAKSSTASPFTSPRASPRLAFAQPIPHSPNLNAYEFSESGANGDDYGDYGSDTVDWLVNDDTASNASSTGLSAAAAEWIQPQQQDMGPFDMLRSVLGDGKTDDEIERALEENGYDLSATMMTLMAGGMGDSTSAATTAPPHDGAYLVGKSMNMARPVTPAGQTRSPVVCKYWLSTGQCLRADCRFAHDVSNHVCK